MHITEKLIEGLDNKISYKKKKLPVSIHANFPIQFYFTYLAYGSKNTGKTYSIVKMISSIEKYPPKSDGEICPIRTIWCSPTANMSSNGIVKTLKSLDDDDIHDDVDEDKLKEIFENIQSEKAKYDDIEKYNKAYKRFRRVDIMKLTYDEIEILSRYNYEPPHIAFGDLPYNKAPIVLWILDDMIGSDAIFGNKKNNFLNNLVIKHRHYQICLLFTTQSQKSIPAIVRKNIDILQLFKSRSYKVLEDLYEEISALCSYNEFIELYEHCINQEYGNLVVNNHQDAPHRFYCNFHKQLHF